ncbi:DMT family transporter [Mammaliicoccus stepanovicii]|uniref:Transporter, drug/metabolite exporter family n=1 Tax=Mammaliicoccus stepanovicii TaxID=643214 RepID=A0A239YJT1_9STAP|nr:DMT family transporter [Mammaliicoccus stepanovicii]PNZ77869.1 EamA family transporter [Mammaliicoccus stepanovicii]GGI40911.1 putative transporter YdeD [Mammaliicoccus stepanovicii]SNV58656.1 transporter, drug/metabolite exporter family [Mammaliicoccus stepanovicii]
MQNKQLKGALLVMFGATFWGIGGTVTEKLFTDYHLPVSLFVAVRLSLSGFFLLLIAKFIQKHALFPIFKIKHSVFQLLIYAIFGMLGVQYTFMATIDKGNVAIATLLQFLAPVVILIYLLITRKSKFRLSDIVIILCSLFGTSLLLTNGDFSTLSVPTNAIIWGLLTACAAAFYTVYAVKLFLNWPSLVVIGWSMLIGGIVLSILNSDFSFPWQLLDLQGVIYFIFVITFGTMFAFWMYLESVKYINPQTTALLGVLEPVTAVISSVIWLKVPFGIWQLVGMIIILAVVLYMSLGMKPRRKKKKKIKQYI